MKRFFIFAVAAALVAGTTSNLWSQAGGGGGGAGGAGGSGGAGGAGGGASGGASSSGGAGTAGTAGASGTAGRAGATGTAGTAGAAGTSAAPGTPGATNRAGAAGNAGIGTDGSPGLGRGNAGVNGRANANAGLNNAAARANVNGLNGQTGVSQTPFFSDPGVRRQLNLNDNQFNSLNNAHRNAFTRYNQAINNLNRNTNLTPEQRALQMQQLQSQFNQNLSSAVNSTLTNPEAVSRFNQLNRQFMNFNAFNDPSIRQQLNLTPEQTRQLRSLSNNWRQQLQQFRRGAGNDLSSVDSAQWNQMWQQYATQLNSVLTPEQQQIWMQQVGQPHVFSPNVVLGDQQSAQSAPIGEDNRQVVDPTVPKYFPDTTTTTQQGTQPTTTNQGATTTTTQGTSTQGTGTQATGTQGAGGTQGTATSQGTQGGTRR